MQCMAFVVCSVLSYYDVSCVVRKTRGIDAAPEAAVVVESLERAVEIMRGRLQSFRRQPLSGTSETRLVSCACFLVF
jgi:hypothetical protein